MTSDSLRSYYHLTKPGIIRGNAITAFAGFFLASKGSIDFTNLVAMVIGLSLIIASGCVFNNYIDRKIDKKMSRTKKRALVTQEISTKNALVYASTLGFCGLIALLFFTNLLTASIALLGFIFYVIIYGFWKRRSIYGTLVGSISGAVPPVVGYTAVTDHLDTPALLLFIALVFWQMPHFYSIAIFRLKDYKAASIPVLPAIKGINATKLQILLYVAGFGLICLLFTLFEYTGYAFIAGMTLINLYWFVTGFKGIKLVNDQKWAKQMFGISLIVLLTFSTLISVDTWLL